MIRIMFVCLGNICRSPMAEFVFKRLVEEENLSHQFVIASSGTSSEEVGNPVHRGTVKILREMSISCDRKRAVQLTKEDYDTYDYLICMETSNIRNALRIVGGDRQKKIHRLLDFAENPRDISDPWYTGNFDSTYQDVKEGSKTLLMYLRNRHGI